MWDAGRFANRADGTVTVMFLLVCLRTRSGRYSSGRPLCRSFSARVSHCIGAAVQQLGMESAESDSVR